jgi:ABC-type multidrug transport system ATPase subunit
VAAARRSVRETLAAVNLTERARSRMRTLSHGMRKRAMVAQCFVGRPEVVLLDEPLNGLDPVEADRLRRFILGRRGRQTIVISSHNLEDIERLCTHVAFIDKGRVTRMDSVASITHAMDRVAFTLTHEPSDIAALSAAVPGAAFEWRATERLLICTFGNEAGGLAAVNRRLLPALLAQTDVLAVASGLSLEEAFLSRPPTMV